VIPNNPVDQDVLINLVTFLEYFLPLKGAQLLKWLNLLIPECIQLAQRFPLISSLYRIFACVFKVIENIDVMADCGSSASRTSLDLVDESMDFSDYLACLRENDDLQLTQKRHFFQQRGLNQTIQSLKAFIRDVELQLPHFTDELLSSALSMILLSPSVIVDTIQDLVPSLKLSLQTGYQVKIAVVILNRFISRDESKRAALLEHLPSLLRLLEDYLVVSNSSSLTEFSQISLRKKGFINSNKGQGSEEDMNIQHLILRLLGRLGGDNQLILEPPDEVIKSSLSWTDSDCIFLKLPLPISSSTNTASTTTSTSTSTSDLMRELRIPLDRLLPRIIEICNAPFSSTDRQLRLSAAECLHSILIYIIGIAATSPDRTEIGKPSEFGSIYSRLFPVVIGLSIDSDPVCRKLFDKLLFQLIHWFSGRGQVHEEESSALLDALIAGLCSSVDGSRREQCAKGIHEFFIWIVKQSSKAELSRHPASSEELFRRLLIAVSHPNETCRLGAAVVLGKMHTTFREETSLVHRYSLHILYVLLKSISQGGSGATIKVMKILSTFLFIFASYFYELQIGNNFNC
jgi:hypothetical protein